MSLPYKGELIPQAKELRKNATPQENHLWYDFLRTYPVRFQRQKAISSFIVDFYCSQAMLAIEVDGTQHYTPQGKKYDQERTYILTKEGVCVLRFSNYEVDNMFYEVCDKISNMVQRRIAEQPNKKAPSPRELSAEAD